MQPVKGAPSREIKGSMKLLETVIPICLLTLAFVMRASLCRGSSITIDVTHPWAKISPSIRLQGASRIQPESTEIVLTSASLLDENTLEQPRKVAQAKRSA
jgi:hypothetical protein